MNSDRFLTNRKWIQHALKGKNWILRDVSALEYLDLFNGYSGEDTIMVYSDVSISEPGIEPTVRKYEDLEYISDSGIYCCTMSQVVNDMLVDPYAMYRQELLESLSSYFFKNNKTFDGIEINKCHSKQFLLACEYALDYHKI